jgi:tetratricopeptide (TPR) repeat protein
MVALVSPAGKGIRKPFNWGRVMRHEIVHVFNLEQTKFLVPHWLTEGLAVSNEGFPKPQQWNQLLRERVPAGELMDLDSIDLGFIRPRSPLDWNMAYCQALLYVEYLKKEHGEKVIGELLAAYRDGLSTDAVLKKVCKTDKATFEKGYRAYLDEVVKGLGGKPAEKRRTFNELKAEVEKNPKPELVAELAEMYLARDRAEARKLASQALEKEPHQPTACRVMARLARAAGNPTEERKMLEAGLTKDAPDAKLLKELGQVYYNAGDLQKAAEMFELGRKHEPYEADWLQQLSRVYAQTDDKKKLLGVLKELVPTDADDIDRRKRLARLLAEEGDHAGAERYARQALEIDVRDAEVRELLFKALTAQKKDDELARLKKVLGQ